MKRYFEKLYTGNAEMFHQQVAQSIDAKVKCFIVTANPETFMMAQNDTAFDEILVKEETTIVADGIGVVRAAQQLGHDVPERVTGVELAQFLLAYANEKHLSVLLYGAAPDVQEKLQTVFATQYPNARSWHFDGYNSDPAVVTRVISDEQPDIVLVALGVPRQEKFIDSIFANVSHGIFVGVGGALDVISGTKRRAPKVFQKLNLEWLYRICREPKRIKRFIRSNILFVGAVKRLKREKD